MSLESEIQKLNANIERLCTLMQGRTEQQAPTLEQHLPKQVQQPQAAPQVQQATPAPTPTPTPTQQAPQTQMPAPPSFAPQAQPQQAPQTNGAPFSDAKGLHDYIMTSYKAMGPARGAQIQQVLNTMGYQNVADVNPLHYGEFHKQIEALKASA